MPGDRSNYRACQGIKIIAALAKAKSDAENARTVQIKIIALAKYVSSKAKSTGQGGFTSGSLS